ncbi:Rab5-interacting family protein, partial [Prunus dulcis]
ERRTIASSQEFGLYKLFVSSQKAEGMGGHNDSSASEKKLSEAANVVPTLNAENLQSNMKVIYYSRTFMSIIGGVIAEFWDSQALLLDSLPRQVICAVLDVSFKQMRAYLIITICVTDLWY